MEEEHVGKTRKKHEGETHKAQLSMQDKNKFTKTRNFYRFVHVITDKNTARESQTSVQCGSPSKHGEDH